MDTGVYLAVLGRHKRLLAVGLGLAVALALLSSVQLSLSPPGVELKLKPTLSATSQILVTQTGAPTSRVALITPDSPVDASGQPISEFGDPARFEYLARLYAQLASTDAVKKGVLGKGGFERNGLLHIGPDGDVVGRYTATAYSADEGSLPIITIQSESDDEAASMEIARRATNALRAFIQRSQTGAGIAADNRVELAVITNPDRAIRVKGRPFIVPLAVFSLILLASVFAVFFRDNLKRAPIPAVAHSDDPPQTNVRTEDHASENRYLRERRWKPTAVGADPRERPSAGAPTGGDRWAFREGASDVEAGGERLRPRRESG